MTEINLISSEIETSRIGNLTTKSFHIQIREETGQK